jgi:hypothetical protein
MRSDEKQVKINWSKLSKEEIYNRYTACVESKLSSITIPEISGLVRSPSLIDKSLESIVGILLESVFDNVPVKKFSPHLKPGWTPELNTAHGKSKRAYKAWVAAGRPRRSDHPLRKQYKEAKANFRAKLRQMQANQRDAFFQSLDLNCQDTGKLFRLIRRQNGTTTEPTSTISYGGCTYAKGELPNAWADYFASLATPNTQEAESTFQQSIKTQYCSLLGDSAAESVTYTLEEVSEAVKSLKCNKTVGSDELDPEHLIYGGDLLLEHLTQLFNAIMEATHIPPAFLHGLVIPIPKGHNKDLSIPNNYRGITILSNMSKVLEKLLLLKIHQQDSPPRLNPLQGGFREHVGCAHTAFVLQEAIQSLREKGKKAYVAYLDVRKAFDTVWHQGLLVKLHQKGIRGSIWHIINKWYTSSTSSVIWDNQQSRSFPCHQGVRQGGVLSPFLYCLFVDELLDILTQSGYGVSIDGVYCGSPMYADDLALVASSPEELQAMMDIVATYANKWQYQLNANKSSVMVLGESTKTRLSARSVRKWYIGQDEISETDEQHHLGILRTVFSSTIHRTLERCTSARSSFFALNSIGSRFGCLHPLTSYRLYQTLCIPILLYGAEIWTLSKVELNMLERVHRKILRTIQGLPTRCHSSSLTSMLGSTSIESFISQRKLNSINSIICLDEQSLPKKLLSKRSQDSKAKGLIPDLEATLDHLNLPGITTLLDNPVIIKPASWKRSIKKQLGIRPYLEFREVCQDYSVSECDMKIGRPLPHWSVTVGDVQRTRANNFRIRLLAGCDGLEKDAARFRSRSNGASPGDPSCKLCGDPTEGATHFIACCAALESERVRLISSAPSSVQALLPDHVMKPREFSYIILGTNWIPDCETQFFCIDFLSSLKSFRLSKPTVTSVGREATLP